MRPKVYKPRRVTYLRKKLTVKLWLNLVLKVLIMNYRYWILLLFVALFSGHVIALSCSPTQDRIFAVCDMGVCKKFLYIVEVNSYSQCSRRPSIEQSPNWVKEVFEFEIHRGGFSADKGIYELTLQSRLWSKSYLFSNIEEYRRYSEKANHNEYPLGVLTRITGQSLEELETEWKLKSKKEYRKMFILKALDWLSLVIASLCLVYSTLCFYKWQQSVISIKWAILAITIQTLIFTIAFVSVSNWSMPLIAFLGIFIPGIWLYQAATFINLWWSNRNHT